MKSIISKSIVVAFASAATLATQASAQLVANTGNLGIAAPTIVGSNSATAQKHQAVTISGVLEEIGETAVTTNRRGVITTNTPVEKFSYSNRDILESILETNVVSGWRLFATNAFNNPNIATKVVAIKTTNPPVPADDIFTITIEDQLLGNTTVRQTNGTISQSDGKGLSSFKLVVAEDLEYAGTGKTVYNTIASHKFVNGTNKTTNTYVSESLKGTFQGIAEILLFKDYIVD